jgi:hypothetical protein
LCTMSAIVVLNWNCYRAGALKTASPPDSEFASESAPDVPGSWRPLACSACSTRGFCPAREVDLAPCPHAATTFRRPALKLNKRGRKGRIYFTALRHALVSRIYVRIYVTTRRF